MDLEIVWNAVKISLKIFVIVISIRMINEHYMEFKELKNKIDKITMCLNIDLTMVNKSI